MKSRYKSKDCLFPSFWPDKDPRIWLYLKLGPTLFRSFQKKFGGRKISVPKLGRKMPCVYCPLLPKHIRILYKNRKDTRWIAKRFSISRKHVYTHLKSYY